MVVNSRDISERKRTEACIPAAFGEISTVLVDSLDYKATLANIARLAVPTLADFCFFDVVTADEKIQRIAWQHKDSEKQAWFAQVQHYLPQHQHPIAATLLTHEANYVPQVSDAWMQAAAGDAEELQFLRDLRFALW